MTDLRAQHADQGPEPEAPRSTFSRRQVVGFLVFAAVAIALLYGLLPRLAGLGDTWQRIKQGDPWWLAAAFAFELLSFGGYVALFRGVFTCEEVSLGWLTSYRITMAGVAATRLLAAGGAGGMALTAWALRRAGMTPRTVASRMTAFFVLLYGVFMVALLFGGVGLRSGVLPGEAPWGLTVVPAVFGAVVIAAALGLALVPHDLDRRVAEEHPSQTRRARVLRWLATVPATVGTGVRHAIGLVRTGDVRLLGAVAWWGFDVAVLWASLHAFGESPPIAVIVMSYYVGMLANLLPLPGGIGGVDGGMIGALIAFGVDGGAALVAVLSYRFFAFWLPTIPGGIAYFTLVRSVRQWQAETPPLATAGAARQPTR
ncbi:MAG TPA: lysylphosphatidylglycerol synthase transmembrane domain-containing protein [Solirubrobacteraceae bacterium]|nr:lysylphosphatidylglycerol synthase transmembrane domain-containing protein [Solirubrobacteraceae bacterium]